MLVEGCQGHDVAIGRCLCILTIEHEPKCRVGPPMEKTMLDKDLHACVGDVGVVPRLHGKRRRRSKDFLAAVEERGLQI